MSWWNRSAMTVGLIPGVPGCGEWPNPGRLGATTSNASAGSPPWAAGSVSGPMILLTS